MTADLIRAISAGYTLNPEHYHGVYHWGRVLDNGTQIAKEIGADLEIVQLFALFHDSRRINENRDPDHGRRGAEFAATLRGELIHLETDRFEMLHYACSFHTDGLTDGDPTVQACWDADRLDLGRVYIDLNRKYLCTSVAKRPSVMQWADDRARDGHVTPEAEMWMRWWGDR